MQYVISRVPIAFLLAIVIAGTSARAVAQQRQTPADEVVRTNVELVQTAITVVDKNGKFVEGLDRADFELLIDGKPRPINFLERITAGSERETQLSLRKPPENTTPAPAPTNATVRGRTIIFFIDDAHLSLSSLNRTRQMIAHFLDKEINGRDSVAIASARGQIGFLQQFTNNKEVLRAALARVNRVPSEDRTMGMGSTPMSEFVAMTIESKPDTRQNNVMSVYVEECLKQSGMLFGDRRLAAVVRQSCERLVKSNARNILMHTGQATDRMYQSLETLMRSSARLPGRKIVFFVSDGFMSQGGPMGGNLSNKIKQITDAAQRANTVLYTIDARGLVSGTLDATNNLVPDANGRMAAIAQAEILATQDALHALAEDTGGRALRNQNYFDRWVEKVLDETSNYYFIAWRPSSEEEKETKFRNVKISIAGRPELTVRAPRGYVETKQAEQTARESSTEKTVELPKVLADAFPSSALQTMLSLTHLNTPANGPLLTSSFQIASRSLDYGDDGKQPATVKLAGVILNDKGKIAASFQKQLNVQPLSGAEGDSSGIVYNHREPLAPGIYQVRVAARDERSRRIGSAMQWIVIPDLSTRQLTLSSVLLAEQVVDEGKGKDVSGQVQPSVDHHFLRSDHLGYWIFVYNAKRDTSGTTNLLAETEVLRDGKVVLTAPQRKLDNSSPDPDRIPYGADLSLKSLAPGTYELRVKITDALAGTSATQATDFVVQ
jgi:VWFA-related protein